MSLKSEIVAALEAVTPKVTVATTVTDLPVGNLPCVALSHGGTTERLATIIDVHCVGVYAEDDTKDNDVIEDFVRRVYLILDGMDRGIPGAAVPNTWELGTHSPRQLYGVIIPVEDTVF